MVVPPKLQPNLFVNSFYSKHWVTYIALISVVPIIRYSPRFYLYLKKTLGYITLMGVSPKLQPNLFVSFTYSKQWVTLHSCVCHLNYSPICLLALPIQNNGLYCPHGCGTCTYGFNLLLRPEFFSYLNLVAPVRFK